MTPHTYKLVRFLTRSIGPHLPLPSRIVALVEDSSDASKLRMMTLEQTFSYMAHNRLDIPNDLDYIQLLTLQSAKNTINPMVQDYDITWNIRASVYQGILDTQNVLWAPTVTGEHIANVVSTITNFTFLTSNTTKVYDLTLAVKHSVVYRPGSTNSDDPFVDAIIKSLEVK